MASDTRGRQAGVGWRRFQCPATDWGTVAGGQNGADRSTPRSGRSAREQEARLRCRHTPSYALPRSREMGATTRIVHGLTRSRRRCAGAIGLCNLAPTSRRPFVPSEPTTRRCADSRPFFDKPTLSGTPRTAATGRSALSRQETFPSAEGPIGRAPSAGCRRAASYRRHHHKAPCASFPSDATNLFPPLLLRSSVHRAPRLVSVCREASGT